MIINLPLINMLEKSTFAFKGINKMDSNIIFTAVNSL